MVPLKWVTILVPLALIFVIGLTAQPARADYRQKAEEETDFIQAHFYDATAQRYRAGYPADPKALPYDFMWANGVQLSVLALAAQTDPVKYSNPLYDFTRGLEAYWDPAAPVPGYNAWCSGPGGTDKYYDDNAWVALDFVEAFKATHDPLFLQKAYATQRFVLSGWDDTLGGGLYWKLDRQGKNACSNAPAAAAALSLVQTTRSQTQLAWALRIRDWTNSHLQDTDGLYWDNVNMKGEVQKTKWTYNTALMIRTDLLLYRLKSDKSYLTEAKRLSNAGLAAWTDPKTGSLQKTEDSPRFSNYFCEALLRLYDETHDPKYLNAVRRQADFAYAHVRDPQGGYWDNWKAASHAPDERKSLIENASVARLFWLLAPYPEAGG